MTRKTTSTTVVITARAGKSMSNHMELQSHPVGIIPPGIIWSCSDNIHISKEMVLEHDKGVTPKQREGDNRRHGSRRIAERDRFVCPAVIRHPFSSPMLKMMLKTAYVRSRWSEKMRRC